MTREQRIKRFFEILPGVLTWSAILLPIILSFVFPVAVAFFVITFDLYWLIKSVIWTKNMLKTFIKMRRMAKVDWIKKCESLKAVGRDWEELYQVIIIVTYKESLETLRTSIASYVKANYPREKMMLVMGVEERDEANGTANFKKLKEEFGQDFALFEMQVHPKDIPGEIPCKSANATFAAKWFKTYLDKKGIAYERVLVSNFDADTSVHKEYFAHLAFKYLTAEDPVKTSFQPIHMYDNNIWQVPALVRLVAFGSSFVMMNDCLRPTRFRNFSSRSNCFKTIVDIGYWCVDAIPEDSHQYYDSYFFYKGKHKVEPLLIPVYMDAALSDTYVGTFKNQYLQLRRWAWGCTDISYVVGRAMEDKGLSWWNKTKEIVKLIEWHFSWATAPIFVTFVGWMPLLLNPEFANTVLGYSTPKVAGQILTLASGGLLVSIILSLLMLPPIPHKMNKVKYVVMVLQWFLFPVVSILLSSVPAIDAQTRLMFGKYMEYRVTEKAVSKVS